MWYGVTRAAPAPDMPDFDLGLVNPPSSEESSNMHAPSSEESSNMHGDISSNKYQPP
jgi:hypothetical protein